MKPEKLYNDSKRGLLWHPNWPVYPTKPGAMSHQEFFTEYYEDEIPAYNKAMEAAISSALKVANEEEVLDFVVAGEWDPIIPNSWIELPEGTTVEKYNNSVMPNSEPIYEVIVHLPKESSKPEPDNSAHSYTEGASVPTSEGMETPRLDHSFECKFESEDQSYYHIYRDGKIWMGAVERTIAIEIVNKLNNETSLREQNTELRKEMDGLIEIHHLQNEDLQERWSEMEAQVKRLEEEKAELLEGFKKNLADYTHIRDGWKQRSNQWHTYDLMVREYQNLIQKHTKP